MVQITRLPYETLVTALAEDASAVEDVADVIYEAVSIDDTDENDDMSYLMKLEEFISDCGLYSYEGWEDAVLEGAPKVHKFWFESTWKLPKGTDVVVAKRLIGRNGDSIVRYKKSGSELYVRLKVLRRVLDAYEVKNRNEAEADVRDIAQAEISRQEQP